MTAALPDVSRTDTAAVHGHLEWVGMQGIDLPIPVNEPECRREVHARVDTQVDLPVPDAKGIHVSRLYRLLDTLSEEGALAPDRLKDLLGRMIESHRDCATRNARIRIAFELLIRRPALVTEGLSGWKSYPVRIDAALLGDVYRCRVEVKVGYSSTCPCSAALSRQVVERGFLDAFGAHDSVSPADVAGWLRQNASMATPHSQRSEARVTVELPDSAPRMGLMDLIDRVEAAVGTPLQTAVKRADEQAFAALNGQNLMFVEDAARRIEAALGDYRQPQVRVWHVESLHPHDAVAWSSPAR
ncbi:GTP cyclohydrolase FolE2 [Nisaea sp.]|uniref:GTP cyclohydrolase FolE2 n=1 Tax=Nisaea sp. TaxID=2024842 RepID=UPI003B521CA3